jgi:hypothetical protein
VARFGYFRGLQSDSAEKGIEPFSDHCNSRIFVGTAFGSSAVVHRPVAQKKSAGPELQHPSDQAVTVYGSEVRIDMSDEFASAAKVLGALPLGDAAVGVLLLISNWYQAHKDAKELLGELPSMVEHFGQKLSEIKASKTEDCPWLLDIVRKFEAHLQVRATANRTTSLPASHRMMGKVACL